jgi:hypothetical protein
MSVDKAPEPRPIEAKLRALEKFVRVEAFQSSTSLHHHHYHHPFYYYFIIFDTRPRIWLCRFFIYMYTHDDFLSFIFFREALSVNNMVTRYRDYQLKKL